MADVNDDIYREIMNALIPEISDAYNDVLNNARDTLKKHIDEDVYDAYEPVVYMRRSKKAEYGISLGAQVYMDAYTRTIPPASIRAGGKLGFTARIWYHPDGSHKVNRWSSHPNTEIPSWINNVDDSELISRIEKKSPAYNWGQGKVPPRPFWQQFVDEMVDGGEFEKSFVNAMRATENIVADGNVVEDPSDRSY